MNKIWTPEMAGGVCINGCSLATDNDRELCDYLQAGAPSFSTIWEAGDMPIFAWDEQLIEHLNRTGELHDEIRAERKHCVLPWEVLTALPDHRRKSSRFAFSQGSMPSCMGHGDEFARRGSILAKIATGTPFVYDPCNPIVTWYISKGFSTRGGQSVVPMAKYANEIGHFPESLVGSNNQRVPDYQSHTEAAKRHQSALAFIPGERTLLADNIIRCCKAGYGVALGNSTAVSGATNDRNGVKVAVLRGSWAHATSFSGFRIVGDTEYIGWVNSHGPIYGSSDEGEPGDMCWMDRALVERFIATATGYGQPYVVLPETITNERVERIHVPYPSTFRF